MSENYIDKKFIIQQLIEVLEKRIGQLENSNETNNKEGM